MRSIGIEPHFEDDGAVEVLRLRLVLGLEQEGGAQEDQLVHRDARRRVRVIEGALFLGEQLAQRHRARGHVEHLLAGAGALERSRADESARHRIHLDLEGRRAAKLRVDGGRIHRAQLDDRIAVPALDTPRPDDHAGPVQGQIGRIEEECLPRLRLDRVESDALDRRALALQGDRQLQFDAGRPLHELEHFDHLLARKRFRQCGLSGLRRLAGRQWLLRGRCCLRCLHGLCARRGFRGFLAVLVAMVSYLVRCMQQEIRLVRLSLPRCRRSTPFRLRNARPARRGAGRDRSR